MCGMRKVYLMCGQERLGSAHTSAQSNHSLLFLRTVERLLVQADEQAEFILVCKWLKILVQVTQTYICLCDIIRIANVR